MKTSLKRLRKQELRRKRLRKWLERQGSRTSTRHAHRLLNGDRQMTDILQVILIMVNFTHYTRHCPVNDQLVEFINLALYVKQIIFCVLVIYSTHNYFNFIDILVINHIFLRAATGIDSTANGLLDRTDIARRKKFTGKFRGVLVSPEHIPYETGFCYGIKSEARNLETSTGRFRTLRSERRPP